MKDVLNQRFVRFLELAVVLYLGSKLFVSVPDITPLLFHFFGFEVRAGEFATVDVGRVFLRGFMALCLLCYVLKVGVFDGVVDRSPNAQQKPKSSRVPRALSVVGATTLSASLWILIVLAVVVPTGTDVFNRFTQDERPGNFDRFQSHTHDGGVLQTELAIEAVLAGENPYSIDYGDTIMIRARDSDLWGWRSWGYERNPALGHVPYPPGVFVMSIPFKWASDQLFGGYDQRLFYVFAAIAFTILVGLMVPSGPPRRIAWAVAGLGSGLLPFIRIGRNDIVLLAAVAAFVLAVQHRRFVWMGVTLGLACVVKQFAWPLALFTAIWMWRDSRVDRADKRRVTAAFLVTFSAFVLPFLIASPEAFFEDVLAFSLGMTDDAYPIRSDSMGLTSLLLGTGAATTLRDGFPMWIFQLSITLPVIVVLVIRVIHHPSADQVFTSAAVTVFVGLSCSAFFAFNYWPFPIALLAFGLLLSRPAASADSE